MVVLEVSHWEEGRLCYVDVLTVGTCFRIKGERWHEGQNVKAVTPSCLVSGSAKDDEQ